MFIAAATCCPPYAVRYGLIQFSGQDIDATCVQMSKVNCMLYGLNGYQVRMMVAMAQQQESTVSYSPAVAPQPIIPAKEVSYTAHQLTFL